MKTDLLANLSAKLTFETGTDLLLEQFQVDKRELGVRLGANARLASATAPTVDGL